MPIQNVSMMNKGHASRNDWMAVAFFALRLLPLAWRLCLAASSRRFRRLLIFVVGGLCRFRCVDLFACVCEREDGSS